MNVFSPIKCDRCKEPTYVLYIIGTHEHICYLCKKKYEIAKRLLKIEKEINKWRK